MTSNQIAYWKLKEDERHNRSSEATNDMKAAAESARNIAQAKEYDRQPIYKEMDNKNKELDRLKDKYVAHVRAGSKGVDTFGKTAASLITNYL